MVKDILLLGEPKLYEKSEPVAPDEIGYIQTVVEDLHDTLMDFRHRYKSGRAIAAPQIGVSKRLIYMNIDEPVVIINPLLRFPHDKKMSVLDDCMSFPGLYVHVERYASCIVRYFDMNWKQNEIQFDGDLSELIQHEYDHLDGILATMRAISHKSFVMKAH